MQIHTDDFRKNLRVDLAYLRIFHKYGLMKTTLILKDELVRRAKSRAALRGWTLSRYLERCLEKGLGEEELASVGDWIDQLPQTPAHAQKEVDARLKEADFERVDEEMWK